MQNLDRRVAALEAQQGLDEAKDVILVGFDAAGEPQPALQTLTSGGLTWQRHEVETEDQFIARACAEVPRARACIPVVFIGD